MSMISRRSHPRQTDIRRYWSVMNLPERFEQVVATVLGLVIALIIMMALWELMKEVYQYLFVQHAEVLSHRNFQTLFGSIMTLLIAMEFQHSIIKVIERREHIIQTKIVILIAMLAVTRKFIILDYADLDPMTIVALAAGILALGLVFWLIDQREQRLDSMDAASDGAHRDGR
ncbi:phosphate-starvation-inducible PsiE family protein [Halothiobacillus diazotrophicus]